MVEKVAAEPLVHLVWWKTKESGVIMGPAMAGTGKSGHDAQILEYHRLEKIKLL